MRTKQTFTVTIRPSESVQGVGYEVLLAEDPEFYIRGGSVQSVPDLFRSIADTLERNGR